MLLDSEKCSASCWCSRRGPNATSQSGPPAPTSPCLSSSQPTCLHPACPCCAGVGFDALRAAQASYIAAAAAATLPKVTRRAVALALLAGGSCLAGFAASRPRLCLLVSLATLLATGFISAGRAAA